MRYAAALIALLTGLLFIPATTGPQAGWLDAQFDGSKNDPGQQPPKAEADTSIGATVALPRHFWVVVEAPSKAARNAAAKAGVSIEEVSGGTVAGTATRADIRRLEAAGLKIRRRDALDGGIGTLAFPAPDKAFHDYSQVENELEAVASANRGLASKFSIGQSLSGKNISAIRFNTSASGAKPSTKPGIVFLGTHHAREHLSTEVPLLLAKWLAANRERADVKKLLETRDIYIVPLVNPDGAEYDHASGKYVWQRKNMRKNADGSLGVDLNRNYGYHWNEGGASDDPGSDTYHGPSAFSEPESQAVKRFVDERPNLKVLLSYHTFSELILYPWGYSNDAVGDAKALQAFKNMAQKMAGWTGYTPEQSSELYIASGDTCDWAWGEKHIFAFTFELTPRSMWEGGFYPGAGAIQPTFAKNIDPALYLIGLADDPYRAAGDAQVQAPRRRFPWPWQPSGSK